MEPSRELGLGHRFRPSGSPARSELSQLVSFVGILGGTAFGLFCRRLTMIGEMAAPSPKSLAPNVHVARNVLFLQNVQENEIMRQLSSLLLLVTGLWITAETNVLAQRMPGIPGGLQSLPFLTDAETRSISAENPTGEKGKGGMKIPDPTEPPETQAASARAADDLGQGWKVKPFIRVNAGETATLMDVDGPGVIQHIWMVEQLSRDHVLRFYWDFEETPSIEVPVPDFFAVGHEKFAKVNSLAVIVNPANSLNCYWPMPFRAACPDHNFQRGSEGPHSARLSDHVSAD